MRKIFLILLCCLLICGCFTPAMLAVENETTLASDGKTDYTIVISENAKSSEVTAANELSKYLEQITGVCFPVVRDNMPETETEIVVGTTNREKSNPIDVSQLGDEGVRILSRGKKLFLTGGRVRGAYYSVYTFLEDWLGCRWFTKSYALTPDIGELIVVPENKELKIGKIDYTYVPPFELRQTYWMFSTGHSDYSSIHKLHGLMAYIPEELGGFNLDAVVNSVHSMQSIVTADMFEEHPEYFGMDKNGQRTINRQPCFSNDDVLDLTVAAAKRFFAQYSNIFSVSQNDGYDFCCCDKCTEFNNAHGGVDSASLLNFVNRVSAEVCKEYPDARIETLAYQNSEAAPTGIEVGENVIIRLCPIFTCVLHDLDDKTCKDNAKFDKNLTAWSKLTDRIYVWDYSTNFQYIYALYPNLTTLQARYQYFRDRNVIAIFDNGCGDYVVPGEFHELRTYIIAKLMWNPDTDVERHIREFCQAYYGAAGDNVVRFIETFEKAVKGYKVSNFSMCHMSCHDGGESLEKNSSLTEIDVAILDLILKDAFNKDLNNDQKKHLEGLEISWRFFKNATWAGEFNWLSPFTNPEEESEKLYNDMKDYGITYLAEAGGVPFREEDPNFRVRPSFWYFTDAEKPIITKLEEKVLPVINKVLRIVFVIPNFIISSVKQ